MRDGLWIHGYDLIHIFPGIVIIIIRKTMGETQQQRSDNLLMMGTLDENIFLVNIPLEAKRYLDDSLTRAFINAFSDATSSQSVSVWVLCMR